MMQLSVEKLTKQDNDLHILEMEMRLKLKVGQYKTLVRYNEEEKETLPAYVTKTEDLLGKLTLVGLIL
jgi:hypothetical protein